MDFGDDIMPLFDITYVDYIIRIVIASICGLLIGLERKTAQRKPE